MAKTIKFKSKDDIWRKEYLGIKPNTFRKFTFDERDDIRKTLLDDFLAGRWTLLNIEIENVLTGEIFIRRVTDVTFWDSGYIISWFPFFVLSDNTR